MSCETSSVGMTSLTPFKLGSLELRNRILCPAMESCLATPRGMVTERLIAWYSARARGGAGMIIIEATSVSLSGRNFPNMLCIYDDRFIPGLRNLTEALHREGTRVCAQLVHAGRQTTPKVVGIPPISASANRFGSMVTRAMTKADIKQLVKEFGDAAWRAKQAGFDAVELHAAHGYMLQQFLSPFTNRRTDEYGGSLENRLRFTREVINEVRARIGNAIPIILRLSVDEEVENGLVLENSIPIAQALSHESIDALHISAGTRESPQLNIPPMCAPHGTHLFRAKTVREALDAPIPIIGVGRITSIEEAEQAITSGAADLVAMGRAHICDPAFIAKFLTGRKDEIRHCIGCNDVCSRITTDHTPIGCALNPIAGREYDYTEEERSATPQRVLVIGGGPAGMQAACTAARRGHTVTLMEKGDELGGQLLLAAIPPYKQEIRNFTAYLKRELCRLKVDVRLNMDADTALIQKFPADSVIIATGSEALVPPIPGLDSLPWVTGRELLSSGSIPGRRIAVIGGGLVGCETAEYLAEQGCAVTIVEMLPELAKDADMRTRKCLLERLHECAITIHSSSKVVRVEPDRLILSTDAGNNQSLEDIDALVLCTGSRSTSALGHELMDSGMTNVWVVGDAFRPGRICDAVTDAFTLTCNIL